MRMGKRKRKARSRNVEGHVWNVDLEKVGKQLWGAVYIAGYGSVYTVHTYCVG